MNASALRLTKCFMLATAILSTTLPALAQTTTLSKGPAYVVAEYEITDKAGMKPYSANVESTFKPFGGHFIVRGGHVNSLEGDAVKGGVVVIAFDSFEKAQAWYDSPAYTKLRPIRQRSAKTRVYIIQGTEQ